MTWIDDVASPADIHAMEKETLNNDPFDKLKLKSTLWKEAKAGEAVLGCKSCSYGKVLYLKSKNSEYTIPWAIWGRILQWFSLGIPIRIFFFMTSSPRLLPFVGENIGAECINGGYTYPCRTDAIVLYRYEEATRVLIHELLHAACTDNFSLSTEVRETKTEVWAELFYIALLSKGSPRKASHLWQIQKQWIVDLDTTLQKFYGVRSYSDYVYRYTIAREEEFNLQGINFSDIKPTTSPVTSCRFTSSELDKFQES